jgi:hypothetical protein
LKIIYVKNQILNQSKNISFKVLRERRNKIYIFIKNGLILTLFNMIIKKESLQELQEKINKLENQITYKKNFISNEIKKIFLIKKCEYCGCYNGIHKTDCSFFRNI